MQLRPVTPDLEPALTSLVRAEAERAETGVPRPSGAGDAPQWISRIEEERSRGEAYTCAIEDGNLVGVVRLGEFDAGAQSAQLSFWVAARFRGRGYARAAAAHALTFAFSSLDRAEVRAYILPRNVPSRRVAEALGFRVIGKAFNRHIPKETMLAYSLDQKGFQAMLTIRSSQMDAFKFEGAKQLIPVLLAELRAAYSHRIEGMEEEELRTRIQKAFADCWRYGMRQDRELIAFAKLQLVIGPNFHQHPPFRSILESRMIPPSGKLSHIFESATRRDWEEARQIQTKS